jgi:RNA polymerase sigma-B factor
LSKSITSHDRCADERLLNEYARDRRPAQLARLVERYQPLARSLANRYLGSQEPLDDLLQVADLGLIKAVQGYDPDRPNSFVAYAVPTILGELKRHFRDRVWNLRLPRALQESTVKVESATQRLTEQLGHSPDVAELASATGLSSEEVEEALVARVERWTSSFETSVGDEDDSLSVAEQVGALEPGYDRVEADLACSTATLTESEEEMIRLRFGACMTQADIGDRLGCSQIQVSRISRAGLSKLLAAVRAEESASVAA